MYFNRFKNYTAEEFLEDPDFRSWIRNPTADSNNFWAAFIREHPQQQHALEHAQARLSAMIEYFDDENQIQLPEQDLFRSRLLETMVSAKAHRHIRRNKRNRNRIFAIAASLMILLGFAGLLWQQGNQQFITYSTGFEEWKTIILPDESVVMLNANSALKLDQDWDVEGDRKVWLKGEAFFEIERKPETGATFSVFTDDLSIEVLGTSFNVHSRGEQTNVFLEEGKIKLDLDGQEKFLTPGALVTYSARKNVITEQNKALASKHISWKDGTLQLKDTPTSEILNKIQEIYGVSIKIETEKIINQVKTVGVPMDKLEVAIPILERTLDVKITRIGSQLVIR